MHAARYPLIAYQKFAGGACGYRWLATDPFAYDRCPVCATVLNEAEL